MRSSFYIFEYLVVISCFAGFLTAVLQNHARKLKVSVDSLSFTFAVVPSANETEESLADVKVKLNIKENGFTVDGLAVSIWIYQHYKFIVLIFIALIYNINCNHCVLKNFSVQFN